MVGGTALTRAGDSADACRGQRAAERPRSGGPAAAPPSARGFGGTVVAHIAARDLGGTARPAFRPQGVSRTLEAPLDRRAA